MTSLAIVELLAAAAFFVVLGACSYKMKYGKKKEATEVLNNKNTVCEN